MVDLILINEDACVFGNEIPIKCDVSRGAGEEKYNQRKVIKKNNLHAEKTNLLLSKL